MTRKTIRRNLRLALPLALFATGLAGAAEARQETVRWTQDLDNEVAAFHILVGSTPGSADLLNQSIGVPTPDSNGVYSYTLDVDSDATLYVRMTALNSEAVPSPASNEIARSVALGMPGQPIVILP